MKRESGWFTRGAVHFFPVAALFLTGCGSEAGPPPEPAGYPVRDGPDSLALFDYRLLRYTVLHRDGDFGRVFRLSEREGKTLFPDGFFEEGSFLASVSLLPTGREPPPGLSREDMTFIRMDSEGALRRIVRADMERRALPREVVEDTERRYREIGDDYVGIWTDELEVQAVRMYSLNKPGPVRDWGPVRPNPPCSIPS